MILNSIFELLNFRPIWIYNFWTLELLLYWTLYVQIKEEFKSSKIIYSNRSKVQEFKNIVWTLELFLHLIIWRKSSRVQKRDMARGQRSRVEKCTTFAKQPFHPKAQVELSVFKQVWPFTFWIKMKTYMKVKVSLAVTNKCSNMCTHVPKTL